MTSLEFSLIDRMEAKGFPDLEYMRDIARSSRAAFWKSVPLTWLVSHRRHAPKDLFHLAHLGAALHEDCGPCTQIGVSKAVADGIDRALLKSALGDGALLSPLQRDAFRFGREVAAQGSNCEDLRERLEAAIGKKAMVDLALTIAIGCVFPTLKRALGRHTSCARVTIDV